MMKGYGKRRKTYLVLLLCLLMACLCGCSVISEVRDPFSGSLPAIDPDMGVSHEENVTMYYRLSGEEALVAFEQTITVHANEYMEEAVIRQLLEGPPAFISDLSSAFPAGTKLVDVTPDGGILYVTLSRELLGAPDNAKTDAQISAAHRFAVYSLIDSVTANSSFSRVQVLVDTEGTGDGARVAGSLLGFSSAELLEPMKFTKTVLITPEKIVEFALTHIMQEELAGAYPLFAESEFGGWQKPDYAAFETQILSAGKVLEYTIYGSMVSEDRNTAYVRLDMDWVTGENIRYNAKNLLLELRLEGGLYKIGYNAFLNVLQGAEEGL